MLFKGTGFYETDYRSDDYTKAAKADRAPDSSKTADAAGADKAAAKSDAAAPAPPAGTPATKESKPGKESKDSKSSESKPAEGNGQSADASKPIKEPRVKSVHPSRDGRGQGNLRRTTRATPRARRKGYAARKLLIAGAAMIVVGFVVAVLCLDSIARVGIEVALSHVLGVRTTIRSTSIALVGERTSLSTVDIANPAGYTDPLFLTVGTASATANLSTFLAIGDGTATTINDVTIQNIVLTLEHDASGTLNAARIGNTSQAQSSSATPASGTSLHVTVKQLRLEHISIHLRNLVGGKDGVVTVSLHDIVLNNVKSDGDSTALANHVSDLVIGSILKAVIASNIQGLSSEVLGGLNDALKNSIGELPSGMSGPLEAIRGGIGDAIDGTINEIFGGKSSKPEN